MALFQPCMVSLLFSGMGRAGSIEAQGNFHPISEITANESCSEYRRNPRLARKIYSTGSSLQLHFPGKKKSTSIQFPMAIAQFSCGDIDFVSSKIRTVCLRRRIFFTKDEYDGSWILVKRSDPKAIVFIATLQMAQCWGHNAPHSVIMGWDSGFLILKNYRDKGRGRWYRQSGPDYGKFKVPVAA